MGFSFYPAGGPPTPSGGSVFWGGFGRYWGGQNWDRIFEKTRVGFGRTELSSMLSCTEFCALSSGHGPRDLGFQGGSLRWIFYVFVRSSANSCNMSRKYLQNVQKISRKAGEIIEKSTETSAKQCISKEKFKLSLKVHKKCEKQLRYVKILHLGRGGVPPTNPQ